MTHCTPPDSSIICNSAKPKVVKYYSTVSTPSKMSSSSSPVSVARRSCELALGLLVLYALSNVISAQGPNSIVTFQLKVELVEWLDSQP